MLADDAAAKLYPPEDGAAYGSDRNERVRSAFVLGAQWQKDAWKDGAPLPAEVIEKVNRFAANLCEGGQYRDVKMTVEEIWDLAAEYTRGLIVTGSEAREMRQAHRDAEAQEDAMGRAVSEPPDPIEQVLREISKGLTAQTRAIHEVAHVLKARR